MKKLLPFLFLIAGCKTYDIYHKISYPQTKMDAVLKAINQACVKQSIVVKDVNAEGMVNTDWKEYKSPLMVERVRYNIIYTDKEVKVRQFYAIQDYSTGQWSDNNNEPVAGAKNARESFANDLLAALGNSAQISFVKQEIKAE